MNSIEAQALVEFERTAKACLWTEQQFNDTLTMSGSVALCHYHNSELVAYLLAQCVCDECELLQLSVRPDYKRQGIGCLLMQQLMTQLKQQSVVRLLLEVRETNLAALALYKKLGFNVDSIRKDYYPSATGKRENAVLMSMPL